MNEWPRNASQSKRALEIVLLHFEKERKVMWGLTSGERSIQDTARSIWLIRSCHWHVAMDGAKEKKAQIFAIILPHTHDLVTWLDFFARKSASVLPDRPPYFGASNAADRLRQLLKVGGEYLEKDPTFLQRSVDCALWAWMQDLDAPNTRGIIETPDQYMDRVAARISLLTSCMQRPSTSEILLEAIDQRGIRYHKRLAESFTHRCRDWAVVHRPIYDEDPQKLDCLWISVLVTVTVQLSYNRSFRQALKKSRFPFSCWNSLWSSLLPRHRVRPFTEPSSPRHQAHFSRR